jgi:hypothetical protein
VGLTDRFIRHSSNQKMDYRGGFLFINQRFCSDENNFKSRVKNYILDFKLTYRIFLVSSNDFLR